MLRGIIVLAAALALAVLAARVAAVELWGRTQPARALAIWPSHPVPRAAAGMGAIGAAAASGRAPSKELLQHVRGVARIDPLGVDPLLVEGTRALSEGNVERAERLLLEARRRDPRAIAARFLLADLYLRGGRVGPGLDEVSVLARLVPGGLDPLAPALAAYARQPGASAKLRQILDANPQMRDAVLRNLASDPANAEVVLRLAGPLQGGSAGAKTPVWQGQLVQGLVDRGEYGGAYRLWSRLNPGATSGKAGLFNPTFARGGPPPPFNWSYGSGSAGVGEPAGNGTLEIIHYGREDAVLASQTMVLESGRYRLAAKVGGSVPASSPLAWSITCLPAKAEAARGVLKRGESVLEFAVSSGCAAQRLDIAGRRSDLPNMVEATLGQLSLAEADR